MPSVNAEAKTTKPSTYSIEITLTLAVYGISQEEKCAAKSLYWGKTNLGGWTQLIYLQPA